VSARVADAGDAEGYDAPAAAPPVARMAIAVLALLGVMEAAYLSAYKLNLVHELACGTGTCEQVQASPQSTVLGVPVAVLGLGAYVVLLVLALVGVQPRHANARWVALSIFGVAAASFLFSAYLTYVEAFVIYMWCRYCVVSAILMTLIFLLSIPGLRRARAVGA
jgi:uncharacterized membrane protein